MRNLVFLFFISICFSCNAQKETIVTKKDLSVDLNTSHQRKPIAMWLFTKDEQKESNEYLISAEVSLQKGWHIFDFNPGGDGLQIAPAFSFQNKDVEIISQKMEGDLIATKFAGMDEEVRYYENKVRFAVLVRSKSKEIRGSVYYQLCDHEKCLAPTEETFDLNY